ncbi:hypothetical protein A2U01_0051471 [Trifolium medium]|uniref:Uncharacterized protein n=1 Tax=Trifolium medium TaxID=97028 RepID=A0A392R2E9_9FABA|nr:hypothetical protein [Trifolium medium]
MLRVAPALAARRAITRRSNRPQNKALRVAPEQAARRAGGRKLCKKRGYGVFQHQATPTSFPMIEIPRDS